MRLLLTRPLFEAERTAQALRAMGHDVVFAPVLEIENVADVSIGRGPYAAVLMTSGNAARAIAIHPDRALLAALACFAVGAQTAAAARRAGFADVVSADGDGGDLARLVSERVRRKDQPVLYLAGDDRARDMGAELAAAGLRVETVVVYRARAATGLPAEVAGALRAGSIDGVLHYSRRSTAIFVDCVQASGLERAAAALNHYCLSARASEPLAAIDASSIHVAQNPDESAMLGLIPAS